jgi:hypothetical protein
LTFLPVAGCSDVVVIGMREHGHQSRSLHEAPISMSATAAIAARVIGAEKEARRPLGDLP